MLKKKFVQNGFFKQKEKEKRKKCQMKKLKIVWLCQQKKKKKSNWRLSLGVVKCNKIKCCLWVYVWVRACVHVSESSFVCIPGEAFHSIHFLGLYVRLCIEHCAVESWIQPSSSLISKPSSIQKNKNKNYHFFYLLFKFSNWKPTQRKPKPKKSKFQKKITNNFRAMWTALGNMICLKVAKRICCAARWMD